MRGFGTKNDQADALAKRVVAPLRSSFSSAGLGQFPLQVLDKLPSRVQAFCVGAASGEKKGTVSLFPLSACLLAKCRPTCLTSICARADRFLRSGSGWSKVGLREFITITISALFAALNEWA